MIIKDISIYDGSLLHQRFAYRFFRDKVQPLGNIIAFRAPMRVLADHMIDQEDILNKDFIFSEDAVNFLWEIPLLGNNLFGAVAYQRLFNTVIADFLAAPNLLNKKIDMSGDDLMVNEGNCSRKCSVSITHLKDGAALGHTGINIFAGKDAPEFAYSTKLSTTQIDLLMSRVIQQFYQMNHHIFVATSKV